MNLMWNYLSDADNWSGSDGIGARILEHLMLSLGALVIAALIAFPIGLMVGHGRRGDDVPITLGALGRLVAPLGVFCYFALKIDAGNDAVLLGLVILAVPPMMNAEIGSVGSGKVSGFRTWSGRLEPINHPRRFCRVR